MITEVTGLPCAHKLNNYGNKDRLEKYTHQRPGSTTVLECSGLKEVCCPDDTSWEKC